MYKVTKIHQRPAYVRGDLEVERVTDSVKIFKTRKDAKNFIERELLHKKYVYRDYHIGNARSYCGYSTDMTWIHENNGETYRETFTYILEKVQYDK